MRQRLAKPPEELVQVRVGDEVEGAEVLWTDEPPHLLANPLVRKHPHRDAPRPKHPEVVQWAGRLAAHIHGGVLDNHQDARLCGGTHFPYHGFSTRALILSLKARV